MRKRSTATFSNLPCGAPLPVGDGEGELPRPPAQHTVSQNSKARSPRKPVPFVSVEPDKPVILAKPVEPASAFSRAPTVVAARPARTGDLQDQERKAPAFDNVAAQEGIYLYRHKRNKLRVALVPLPANNVVSISIVYFVGSLREPTGMTGSAHILEHELFKSFSKHGGFNIWKTLGRVGAVINASTSKTRTEFHATLPAEDFAKALRLEATRLQYAPLTGLKTERVVVRNEYERGKNNCTTLLREQIYEVATQQQSTIGTRTDIESILSNSDKLRQFFKKFYVPANAAMVVAGTFDADAVLACIDKNFGKVPPGESTRDNKMGYVLEPSLPQRGIRSVDVAGELPCCTLSFRTSDGMSTEGVVLELLAQWMSAGKAGPFAKLLEDPELHSVECDYERTIGVSLFTLWITPISGGDETKRVERLQQSVLCMLTAAAHPCLGLTEKKLRTLKQTQARLWQQEVQSTTSYAAAVVESFARSNYPFDVAQRYHVLDQLTLADVQQTWRKVFVYYRLTLGRVLPELLKYELCDPAFRGYDASGDTFVAPRPIPPRQLPWNNTVVTRGGVYMTYPTARNVCVRVHVPSNDCGNNEAALRAALATTALKLGGKVLKERELQLEFSQRGADVSVTGDHSGLHVALEVPADRDVTRVVQLVRAGLHSPCVSSSEYHQKVSYMGEIAVGGDYDVNTAARGLFSRCVFHNADDPRRRLNGAASSRLLRDLSQPTLMRGLAHWSQQPAWVTCVAPTQAHLRLVQQAFEQDATPNQEPRWATPKTSPYAGRVVTQPMPGKTSCTMMLGVASPIGATHPHALPLSLALDALGGGFASRLMQEVRERRGLTYGISAGASLSDPGTTCTVVMGTFAPTLVEQGVNLTKQLVGAWRQQGITQEELDTAKSRMLGAARIAWDSPDNVAAALHNARLHFERPVEHCQSLPQRVQAVTLQDCQQAIQALPPLENWVCVCAGAVPEGHLL